MRKILIAFAASAAILLTGNARHVVDLQRRNVYGKGC